MPSVIPKNAPDPIVAFAYPCKIIDNLAIVFHTRGKKGPDTRILNDK